MTFSLPDVAQGAVIAALLAAFVSLVGLIITKEQKTSEFRQAWIDALRAECAMLVVEFLRYAETRAFGGHPTQEATAAAALSYRTAAATVRLRLNVVEEPSKIVFSHLDEMEHLMAIGDLDLAKTTSTTNALIASLRPVLKSEWERVKLGEFWFRSAKIALVVLILAATSLLVRSYLGH